MSEDRDDRLYRLLPAHVRQRDSAQGEPLRALLRVIGAEYTAIEDDVSQLYEDWFIETCAEWVVPYLGDLLGVRGVQSIEAAGFSARAYVANTMDYRRRKGTASVLEALGRDVTGWPARVVEYFQRLDTTQFLNHLRLHRPRTSDIRDAELMDRVGGPFGEEVHTGEVRHIDNRRGRYNIPNIGLHFWRLSPYRVTEVSARRITGVTGSSRRLAYTFDPIGRDVPLFNSPATETEITQLAAEHNAPAPLRARLIGAVLRTPEDWAEAYAHYFPEDPPTGRATPAFRVYKDGVEVPREQLRIWLPWARRDPAEAETINGWPNMIPPEGTTLVDVERGRVLIHRATGEAVPSTVRVDYTYGFSADLGGGPYDRTATVTEAITEADWQMGVSARYVEETDPSLADARITDSIVTALNAWNTYASARWSTDGLPSKGVIAVMDNRTYSLTSSPNIKVPPGSTLSIIAADWPEDEDDDGVPTRFAGRVVASDLRPLLRGNLKIEGEAGGEVPGELHLNGLWVEGRVRVLPGDLGKLSVLHCNIEPGHGGVQVRGPTSGLPSLEKSNLRLAVVLQRSIVGGVILTQTVDSLTATECVIDQLLDASKADGVLSGADPTLAVHAPGTDATFEAVTVLGTLETRSLSADDSIFNKPLRVHRRQTGCLRFCFVPTDSQTPRRYRCQPELALSEAESSEASRVLATVVPRFTSTTPGQPGYAQLRHVTLPEIRLGAESGSEMGAFSFLYQPQREANAREALKQYLRFGLEAGLFFET